jgi:phosphoglycolate phosphatase-like HAD superfamily hydrolase
MVHRLMEQSGIHDVACVAKVGDTVNDIEEGKNAGCGLVVGVLSGADGEAALHRAGADLIIPDITHLRIYNSRGGGES